jgi:hypothetical protein
MVQFSRQPTRTLFARSPHPYYLPGKLLYPGKRSLILPAVLLKKEKVESTFQELLNSFGDGIYNTKADGRVVLTSIERG